MKNHEFRKHRGPVTSVAHLGGNEVVTSAYDGAVAKFNLVDNQVTLLGYHDHLVNKIVSNQEGTKAASCSSDYTIKVWDIVRGKVQITLLGHSDDVEDFMFINDELGVSASRDHRILVWDLTTGAVKTVIDGHEKDVLSLAYFDQKIFSSGDDKTLRVWDIDTGKLIHKWGPFEVETDTCAIDINKKRVVLGCDDGFIRVFSIENGELVKEINAHQSGIKKVAISPETGDILSAAYDQNIIIWNSDDFTSKVALENIPTKWERSLVWSQDGKNVLAGTFDGTVLVWEAQSGQFIKEIGDNQYEVGNVCFNEIAISNQKMALVSDDGFIRMGEMNLYPNQPFHIVEPQSGRFLMNAVALNEQSNILATGAHNQKVHLFHFKNSQLFKKKEMFLGEGPINTIRFSKNNQLFVGCYSGAIVHMNSEGEVLSKLLNVHEGAVKSLRLHPVEDYGLSCSAGGEIKTWNFKGEVMNQFLGHTAIINDVDFSPSGQLIASVSRDFTLKIFEFSTGKLLHSFCLGKRSLKSVCFVGEAMAVVGDYWGNLYTVNLTNGKVISKKIANNGISSVASNENVVLAASYDGCIYCVDPTVLHLLQVKKEMLQRLDKAV
ncbi:WD40 repeat domain-containing protein [Chengkuizengella axinellae]|uniref:WD40 repeat domain-containing protein n=1 Tax=Chengkuizengella axinellae TaxID=3064388 RepID=A0ABT9IZR3_9BACL|nr:WD40 repeat domain-containing protein [Chengkuizengella sp. 2205SS18-9]MDP5274846.1 WD40 repeat domain-containing protein [Chengkuizengella sp. 2205SS18-9]